MIDFHRLVEITEGTILQEGFNSKAQHLVTDSRKIAHPAETIFFAIRGQFKDGHEFISETVALGCKIIVVEVAPKVKLPENVSVVQVPNSLEALQKVAGFHRELFSGKMIAITGSNGKTIVKEWCFELLDRHGLTAKSPLSYNSQLGVPLSLWGVNIKHEYALIEAGISMPGEMQKLEIMIRPDIGIMTNIGEAHQEGFVSLDQKIDEKLHLFKNCKTIVYCKDHEQVRAGIVRNGLDKIGFSWGKDQDNDLIVDSIEEDDAHSVIVQLSFASVKYKIKLPFRQSIFIENALHAIALMIHLGFTEDDINDGVRSLRPIGMRLRLRQGIYDSIILDDTYNNDLSGLKAAIDQLTEMSDRPQKTVIISDMLQTGKTPGELYKEISNILSSQSVDQVVTIGPETTEHQSLFPKGTQRFESTDDFLRDYDFRDISGNTVLIKGSRPFRMEQIVNHLQEKAHATVLEISLNRVSQNLNYYRSHMNPKVRIMGVIKALAYGSGSVEMANHLLNHGVHYLAVAYADEGVRLREAGIQAPIMIMNPHPEVFPILLRHKLEPEIYSLSLLKNLVDFLDGREMAIHLKLETGMHRLGFIETEIEELSELIRSNKRIRVSTIFSHLAGSEDQEHDTFTHQQAARLYAMANEIRRILPEHNSLLHLLNTGGITRFPMYQFDMVRLGIGLHGYSPNIADQAYLQPAETLKTFVSQVRKVGKGETIGYARKGNLSREREIATIGIGYADGFSRKFSNGHGVVFVNGHLAPVIGNVCMDMTMIDVTGLQVSEGDEVIVFGEVPNINQLAESLGTIPYEILSLVSERVKRIYTYE